MKKINIVVFGIGNVGSTLIRQILELNEELKSIFSMKSNVSDGLYIVEPLKSCMLQVKMQKR